VRIIHFTNELAPGGVTSVISDLVELQRDEHDVAVGVLRAGEWDCRSAVDVIHGRKLLSSLLRTDVIHCHHRRASLVARILKRTGVVDHVHNVFSGQRMISFRGDVVVSVAQQIGEHTAEQYPHVVGRQRTILNGTFDPKIIGSPKGDNPVFRIVGAGRLDIQKDPLRFVSIVGALSASGIDVFAEWFGEGALEYEFRSLVDKMDLGERCVLSKWLGRDRMITEFYQADCVLMTSRWEGLPMVGIEALSVGTPVISTEIGHFSQILNSASPLWVLDDDDLFGSGLTAVASIALDKVGQRSIARDTWERYFDLEAIREEWNGVYDDARG
jgi:glycosyltransferase involved in cell wall biosynthesis